MNIKSRTKDTFGGKLAELRLSRRLTQANVATVANISTAYYSAIENDKRIPPHMNILTPILTALECTKPEATYLKELAAAERRITPMELYLSDEAQALIIDIRKTGDKLPRRSIKAMREYIRDVTN